MKADAIIVIGLLVGLALMFYFSFKSYDRLMAECLKDHKEYECVSMLHGGRR